MTAVVRGAGAFVPARSPQSVPGGWRGRTSGATPVRWIAHAGLGMGRYAGAPSAETLAQAVRIHVDWIELDVCATRDGRLVLRHDRRLRSGLRVEEVTRAELLGDGAEELSLDEAVEVVGGRIPLVLDIKGPAAARALAGWLAHRRDGQAFAVSGGDAEALLEVRRRAPRVACWRSLPSVPNGTSPWIATLARITCRPRDPRKLVSLAADAVSVARDPRGGRREVLHLAGRLWRRDVALQLPRLAAEVGAAGVVVAQQAISPELCEAAARLRLPVAAWTVNRVEAARQVMRCGVRILVSDRVVPLRLGLAGYGD